MRVGVIGAGGIGATVGRLLNATGHELLLSSRHPEQLGTLATAMPGSARAGTVREAVELGDALLLAVNWWTLPEAVELAGDVTGRIVLDATNPYRRAAGGGLERCVPVGTSGGEHVAQMLAGAQVVKAFNTFSVAQYRLHHRSPEPLAMFYAGDGDAAHVAASLIRDAGFAPVHAGPIAASRLMELGGPLQNAELTEREAVERLATLGAPIA